MKYTYTKARNLAHDCYGGNRFETTRLEITIEGDDFGDTKDECDALLAACVEKEIANIQGRANRQEAETHGERVL